MKVRQCYTVASVSTSHPIGLEQHSFITKEICLIACTIYNTNNDSASVSVLFVTVSGNTAAEQTVSPVAVLPIPLQGPGTDKSQPAV